MYTFGSPSLHWQTSQPFSHLQCTKLFGEAMSSYAAFNGELHADDQTGTSSCRHHTGYDFAIMMKSHCEVFFGKWNIGRLLSKPPIRQNKFPTKIFGHSVFMFMTLLAHTIFMALLAHIHGFASTYPMTLIYIQVTQCTINPLCPIDRFNGCNYAICPYPLSMLLMMKQQRRCQQ